MASQVPPIKLNLELKGLEELTRLKSAFKGLASTIDITDDAINKAVNGIKEYVATANNSEAVIKGQVEAFRKLKSQADITGSTYKKLDGEIKRLEQELKGASEGLIRQRDSLIKSANSTKNSSAEVGKYINQLKKLQAQTRASSQAFNDIESDIESLTFKMRQLRQEEIADFGKNAVNATRGAISGLQSGVQQSISLFKRLGEQSKTAFGQVARTIEGITAIGVGGAVAGGGAGALGGLSGLIQGAGASLGGLKSGLGAIPFAGEKLQALVSPEAIARLNEAASNVAALQAKVAGLDQAMDAVTNAFTAFGPTASAGAIAASAGIAIIYDRLRNAAEETRVELEKSFTGIDDEVQDLIRSLTKLRDQIQALSMTKINELLGAARQRFAAAPAGSPLSRSMASQIAGLEAIGREEAGRQAVVLEEYRQRVRGASESAVDLSQRLSFLKARLQEVDTSTSEGKAEFARLSSETVQLSDQIRKLGDSYRHVGTMATQAATAQENAANAAIRANYFNRAAVRAQEQALAELGERVRAGVAATPLALPAAGQTTAAGTGQEISGGARRLTGQTEFTFGEAQFRNPRAIEFMGRQGLPSAATGVSGATGLSDPEAAYRAQANAARVAAIDLSQYRVAIDNAARANNGSVNSVGKLRDAIIALRNQLSPADADFNRLTKRIQELDAQSERLQVRQGRRRMTGMQMTQAAGAALSGGIFGGPEGFLGGAIGSAFGVGGAFAGAAFGAQIGGLRRQLGEFADYAAQIQKMEIALRNAAGSQDQFNQAMAAAASATQNLNVPQDIAIQGMTKLTAAVKGAGGQVSDAELVFRNVTSAIKATGGSAQDVDGAITAMVQVFSKGKVSAEELSGQLGERLPGAVTKFAKANDMTLPELQKALEQGQVGLNELMNFIVQLGDEYSGVAEKIAGSSQDAGARLTIAFNEMKIAVGEALQPVGAQFQEAFIPFIENIAPVLTATLPAIGNLALGLAKNIDVLAASLAALAAGAIVNAIVQTGGLIAAFKALATAVAASNAVLLLNPWVALAAGIAAATVALIKHNQAQQEYNNLLDNGAGSTDELRLKQRELEADIAATRKALEGNADGMGATGRQAMQLKMKIADLENQLARINKTFTIRLKLEREGFSFDEEGMMKEFTVAGIVYGGPKGARAVPLRRVDGTPLNGRTQFENLAGTGSGSTAKSAADKAAREAQRRFDEELQKLLQAEDFTLKKFALEEKIRLEQEKQGAIQAGTLESEMQLKEIANQRLDLDIRATALASEQAKLEELRKKGLAEGLDVEKIVKKMQDNRIEDLRIQYENQKINTQEIKAQVDLEKERQSLNRALNQELEDRRYELGLITKEEYNRLRVERERRRLEEAYRGLPDAGPRVQEGVDLFKREIDPTFAQGLQSQLAIVRRELDELIKPANQVAGAANAIGDAFSQSFASVINGSATTQEALASFFQNLANYFLDMAAQIIQKMIVMAILNQIVGLLPGSKGGGSFAGKGYFDPITGKGAAGPNFGLAMGGVVSKNGIEPFAMGGIVNKPTLFKYADGGTGRFGLMGEAGPEAIIPLKRGRDGRLGVAGGGGVNVGEINITVQNTGENLTPAAQKQLASQVRGIVLATLVNEQRSGGVLR
jgi:tape measure domain-containing protein